MEAIRRKARARAVQMGLASAEPPPAPAPAAAELPTLDPFVLRGLLSIGRLIGSQEAAARQVIADAARAAREEPAHHE
jgi:hypothetical protein